MIGGSTASKNFITGGTTTSGCEPADQMVAYVQSLKEDLGVRWSHVYTDNGMNTYNDVALITNPIGSPNPETLFYKRLVVVLKARTEAVNSHIICVFRETKGQYPNAADMMDYFPMKIPDSKLPSLHQLLVKYNTGNASGKNMLYVYTYQVYYASVEDNSKSEIVQMDFGRDQDLNNDVHTTNKHRIFRYPMVDDSRFLRPIQSVMINRKNGVEMLMMGGSYWPNGASSDTFCPIIMQAQVVGSKLDENHDMKAVYLDCTVDSGSGPWFSIDQMSSNGPTLMYGLGVARDKDFNLVESSFMLIYQWKYLGSETDADHWFTGCQEPSKRRIIVTKQPSAIPNQIVKPFYITHDSENLIIGFIQYASRNDYDTNNPSYVIGLYTQRTIIDATCSTVSDYGVTYASTGGYPKHSWENLLKPCISTSQLKASGSCDASVFPAKTAFASSHMIYAYTSTYGQTSELNSGGKVGMLYNSAGAMNQGCYNCETAYYEEWLSQNGNMFVQRTISTNIFGSPVSSKAEKGDYEMYIGPLNCYDDLTHYIKVSGATMGCIDPADTVICEIMISTNTDDDFINLDFTGSLKSPLPCNFKDDSLYFSPEVSSLDDAFVEGQLVKRYGWWDSDNTFQKSDTKSQQYFDQFPPIHHPNITSDGTGFTVYACTKTAAWSIMTSFSFHVIALITGSTNKFVSLLEGDKKLQLTFTPWGQFNSSNPNFQLSFDSSDFANYIAQGGIYTTKWEVMTEVQKDANQQYQGLSEGEKFPYFTHNLKSGSTSTAPCNCDPIKLEAFIDEQMTSALSSTSSGYLQTFSITNSPDQNATPFVDIEINLKIPTYTEIWVKLSDKIGLKYIQKMIFSQCGAETFDQAFELTTPIEYDQNSQNDTAYDFQVVRPADIKKYFKLIEGGITGQDPCEVEWMNMYTDVSCTTEYSQASSDGTVVNHLQNSFVNSKGASEQLVAVYTKKDYSPKVYYVKVRTQGLVESPCKPITFQVNLECPTEISIDYSSITSQTKFYYELNTGQYQIDLVPFLAHLGGLNNGKCSLDSSLAFQIKERKSDRGGLAQADLKLNDVQPLSSFDSVKLSTSKWADKDSLMAILNLDTDGFQDCIQNQNAQKNYENCTQNVLLQFWNGQNHDTSYAFLELSLNIYSPEPTQENITVDLTKFMKQQPEEKIIAVNPFLVNQEMEEEIERETELGDQQDEILGLNDEDAALLEEAMSMGIFDDEGGPPNVRFVDSYIPKWKTVADEKFVLQFLQEMQSIDTVDKIEEKVDPRDIKFEVSKISREGHIEILFNQKIKVPPFEEFWGKRRSLATNLRMADINVERDIVNITFALKSSLPKTALKYHLEIVDWTENKIVVFMNFTNPGAVSQGDFRDGVLIEFKNLNWIKAAESKEILKPEYASIVSNSFPKQLPGAYKYEKNAQQASNSMKALLIIQIVLQLLLKGSIDDTWNMFLILQLCAYAQIYDVPFPVNVEIYIEQFRSLIRFEILRPDKLLEFIDPDLSVDKLLGQVIEAKDEIIKGNMQSSGFESASFFKNMIVYVFLVIICLLVIVGMLFLRCSEELKPKVDKILRNALNKFFFNNYVRSITITYLETAISFKIICETLSFNIPLFMQLTVFPLCCAIALTKYRTRLDEPIIRQRMEKMYTNISMRKAMKEPKIVFYYPIFMIRRLMFVMIPLLISKAVVGGNFHTKTYGSLQLYALILFSSFYIVQYGNLQPHDQQKLIVIEFFNETLFMLLHYHMFFFTKFLDQHPLYDLGQGKISYGSGWSYLGCLVIIAVVNLANLGHVTSKNIKRRQRLRRKKILILKQEQMNIIIAQKLKEIMKTSSRDSGLVNPFITKNKIQHEDRTNSAVDQNGSIFIKQMTKPKSDEEMTIDLENQVENLLNKMEQRFKTKNRRNTKVETHKELREKRKRNHLDTIKEEDSKLVDSDLFNQLPDFSMNLESARSKQQSLAKVKPKSVEPAEIAELDDMEKMMVEIEMTQKYNTNIGEQSADETVIGGETLIFTEIDLSNSNKATPQISQQELDKNNRRKTTEAQIKSVVNLKKTFRKRKNLKY